MTSDLAERRKGRTLSLFLLAGALAIIAAVTVGIEMRSSQPNQASGLVTPGLAESIAGAQRITVVSAEASYRIERTQGGWAMRDRDDYPVTQASLEALTNGLEELRYTRRMTNDASKHERLGVTDPRQGGRGILLQIEDGRGALLVNFILGVEPNGGMYVREPDDDQTWAVEGELPPLRDVAAWLALRPLNVDAARFARVEIMPAEGRAYILARDVADQPWRIASPALAPLSQSTLAAAATHLTDLSPTDVRTAPAIQGAPRARVRAHTFDGVIIDAELIESDGATWVKLVARAAAPEQEPAALAINNESAAWAYELSAMEVQAVAPPLSALVPGAAPTPPQ
ncbi:MAG: DUF4340 domain-containing protein [Caulobacterales bacterium]|jgi:hypothetical protein|nr:DUF4340 domain-containing protein [Caulobacterales bacterium]